MKIIDITPMISSKLAVFPGDQSFERKVTMDVQKGESVTLSTIFTTLHLGAHTDAPNHYHKDGVGIDQRDLNYYIGPCHVVVIGRDDIKKKGRIPLSLIQKKLPEIKYPKVLFATNTYPDANHWTNDFMSLSSELIEWLSGHGVHLVGIDTPSVDPADSKNLETHNTIFKKDMAILEGIDLNEVQEGCYTLVALPLKIKNGDASPVRAVLLEKLLE